MGRNSSQTFKESFTLIHLIQRTLLQHNFKLRTRPKKYVRGKCEYPRRGYVFKGWSYQLLEWFVFTQFQRSWTVLSQREVWMDREAPIAACNNICWQNLFVCQFSLKPSTSLTFIFMVKYSNRVHLQVHTRLSRIQWHIGQTLLLPTHMMSHVAFRSTHWCLTLANSRGQGPGYAHFDCEYCHC